MSDIERFQVVMKELGPVLEPQMISQNSDTHWSIFYDDETFIELEYDPEGEKISLYSELGTPDNDKQLSTFKACLLYNFLWKDTGGVMLALDAPDGNIVLVYHMLVSEIDLPLLCSVIRNFAEKATVWRETLEAGGIDLESDDTGGPAPFDFDPRLAIRA